MEGKSIDFGNYFHVLRKAKHLTLKDVADQLHIDISTLSKIENGERQINFELLKEISKVFELDYKELQMNFLKQKIHNEYGNQPFFKESLELYLKTF
mgnify:FL=1|jgi:transcriptional regulator with XRE-family HTH domain